MKYQAPYGVLDQNASYVNGDPSLGREGSIPPAAAFEQPMRELVKVIEATGITPSNDDLEQLWKAVQIAPWIQQYATDTGSANSYSAAIDPVPTQLYVGMRVAIKIGNTNTGPSTLNLNGLGSHSIKRATGANINAGDLVTGQVAYLIFDGANWQIINFLGFTSDTTINNFTLQIPYAVDQGAVNALIGNFSPAVTALAAGNPFLVKVSNTNTGAVTLKANALLAVQVVWPDQSQLLAGEIVAGGIILVIYDGAKFQLMCQINGHGGGGGDGGTTIINPTAGVPGVIDLWPTETPPQGAYECNGQALSRVNDSRLFGIIGTRYGAPDAASFNVPDLRGEFIRGWSHSSGKDPDAATRTNRGDGVAGDHVGTKQPEGFKTHSHPIPASGWTLKLPPRGGGGEYNEPCTHAGFTDFYGGYQDFGPIFGLHGDTPTFGQTHYAWALAGGGAVDSLNYFNTLTNVQMTVNIGSAGGTETRPRNVAMMYIIWR